MILCTVIFCVLLLIILHCLSLSLSSWILNSFPKEYPFSPPSVQFTSQILHPNIYKDGKVCITSLQTAVPENLRTKDSCPKNLNWNPSIGVAGALLGKPLKTTSTFFFPFLFYPNPNPHKISSSNIYFFSLSCTLLCFCFCVTFCVQDVCLCWPNRISMIQPIWKQPCC